VWVGEGWGCRALEWSVEMITKVVEPFAALSVSFSFVIFCGGWGVGALSPTPIPSPSPTLATDATGHYWQRLLPRSPASRAIPRQLGLSPALHSRHKRNILHVRFVFECNV
jgi:hypothetical protein